MDRLSEELNSGKERQDWLDVSDDFQKATLDFASSYLKRSEAERGYDNDDFFVDGFLKLLPKLRSKSFDKTDPTLTVECFVDEGGTVEKVAIRLKESSDFVQISGRALSDLTDTYFEEKEKEQKVNA